MFGKKLKTEQIAILMACVFVAALALFLTVRSAESAPRKGADTAAEAAERMQKCMDAVKEEKLARGISLPPEDLYETGLIGEDFNFITTTVGDLSAKRTAADPNMAAMLVFMFQEAGLRSGDTVGACFSGSFPSLNIAALCACDAMGLNCVYICSCGASTWGANNPEYSFPEMADTLYKKGLVSTAPALITPGGGDDIGGGVDSELFAEIWERTEKLGYPVLAERDLARNVSTKKALLDAAGIDCFVAAGGNISALGSNMVVDLLGQGLLKEKIRTVNEGSGLVELYLHENVPTILLLNIKKLTADWGIPFDPITRSGPGEGPLYAEKTLPQAYLWAALVLEAGLLVLYKFLPESRKNKKKA